MHFFGSMRKRYKILIAALILLLFISFMYLFMTQDGAMRFAVFMRGYPRKAIVMQYNGTNEIYADSNQYHYIISDPPYDAKRDTYEENWIVTRYGFIYIADCID